MRALPDLPLDCEARSHVDNKEDPPSTGDNESCDSGRAALQTKRLLTSLFSEAIRKALAHNTKRLYNRLLSLIVS